MENVADFDQARVERMRWNPGDEFRGKPVTSVRMVAEGIEIVKARGLEGSGGVWLSPERNAQVPDVARSPDGWYPDGIRFAIPVLVFQEEFERHWKRLGQSNRDVVENLRVIRNLMIDYEPDAWEAITGRMIMCGKSRSRREKTFFIQNRSRYVSVEASSGNPMVPDFHVMVKARLGGREGGEDAPVRYYLVRLEDYDPGEFGMVIDPQTAIPWSSPNERFDERLLRLLAASEDSNGWNEVLDAPCSPATRSWMTSNRWEVPFEKARRNVVNDLMGGQGLLGLRDEHKRVYAQIVDLGDPDETTVIWPAVGRFEGTPHLVSRRGYEALREERGECFLENLWDWQP